MTPSGILYGMLHLGLENLTILIYVLSYKLSCNLITTHSIPVAQNEGTASLRIPDSRYLMGCSKVRTLTMSSPVGSTEGLPSMGTSLLSSSLAVVQRPPTVEHYTGSLHWVWQLASLEKASRKAGEIKQEEKQRSCLYLDSESGNCPPILVSLQSRNKSWAQYELGEMVLQSRCTRRRGLLGAL